MMTLNVIAFSIFAILEGTVLAMEEPSSSSSSSSTHNQRLSQAISDLVFDEPAEKRGYTYVSEYKRLPVYNFGLGKRWADGNDKRGRPFSFGLGKRIKPYSFGLGKRNNNQLEYQSSVMSSDYVPLDSYGKYLVRDDDSNELPTYSIEEKRGNRLYNFGLGKRDWNAQVEEAMATGKRPNDMTGQRYMFGLGKRMMEEEDGVQ